MPSVVDYQEVLQRMTAAGFVSLYHHSGAFGFASNEGVMTIGCVAAPDPTIRAEAQKLVRLTPDLPAMLTSVASALGCEAWLMPKSHWHYELHFGNRELLEKLLPTLGVDPLMLRERNNGSAIAFSPEEASLLAQATNDLLGGLIQSDFLIAFPAAQTLCTIHHHKQLWWQTRDDRVAALMSR
jgi:hypothetical protein